MKFVKKILAVGLLAILAAPFVIHSIFTKKSLSNVVGINHVFADAIGGTGGGDGWGGGGEGTSTDSGDSPEGSAESPESAS